MRTGPTVSEPPSSGYAQKRRRRYEHNEGLNQPLHLTSGRMGVVRVGRRVRSEALKAIKGGLRAVYRTLELPGKNPLKDAHAALDAAVLAAYGFSPKEDHLAQLLALNLEVAGREESGEPVTAPGLPPAYP